MQISILLKEIRGNATQKSMSEKLGFRFNQYFKWESGETEISLVDFFKVCDLKKIKIEKCLHDLLHVKCDKYDSNLIGLMYLHWNSYSEKMFLEQSGFSKSKWWRLKNQKIQMTFDDFLIFIETIAGKKDSFLLAISNELKKRSHLQNPKNELTFINSLRKNLEFGPIYSCFFLAEYQKAKNIEERKKILFNFTSIPKIKLESILKELIKDKMLNEELTDVGELFKINFSIAQADISDLFSEYCLNHTLEKLRRGREQEFIVASPILAAISPKVSDEIREILTRAQIEITKAIASEDNLKKDRLAYVYLGMVNN